MFVYETNFCDAMKTFHEIFLEPIAELVPGLADNDPKFQLFVSLFGSFLAATSRLAVESTAIVKALSETKDESLSEDDKNKAVVCISVFVMHHLSGLWWGGVQAEIYQLESTQKWSLEPFLNRSMIVVNPLVLGLNSMPDDCVFKARVIEQSDALLAYNREQNLKDPTISRRTIQTYFMMPLQCWYLTLTQSCWLWLLL